jgi:hypothetical protein
MDRRTATENQAESRSFRSQPSSPDESAGLPTHDSVAHRGLSHVSGSVLDTAHWPSLLEELDVRFLVLDIDHDAELFELFQAHPGWVIDSRDRRAVLLVRTDIAPNATSHQS